MMLIQAIGISAAGGILAGAIVMGLYKDAVWRAEINDIKIEAAQILARETDAVSKLEKAAQTRVRQLEVDDAKTKTDLVTVGRRNRDLIRELGGLRDPGRRFYSESPSPNSTGKTVTHEREAPGARLSIEASAFLSRETERADEAARWANVCDGYSQELEILLGIERRQGDGVAHLVE